MPVSNLAVITGGKAHDVVGFHTLFRSLDGIDSYVQHIDDFASTPQEARARYDAVLFFFMMQEGPTDEGLPGYCGRPKSAIEHLGETGRGIVVLHHALLAYPQWSTWDEIVGIAGRRLSSYQHDEKLGIKVVDRSHPITKDLADWEMVDETYRMPDAAGDNQVLLRTDHPQSMETVAWVRRYTKSQVFCLQSGHDRQTWEDENFQAVLRRGIVWSCGGGG
ncbi:MAG: ThuA domain-containing protein [Anaerolineae bacterium]